MVVEKYCGSIVAKGNYVLVVYVGMGRRREEESLMCSRCFEKDGKRGRIKGEGDQINLWYQEVSCSFSNADLMW